MTFLTVMSDMARFDPVIALDSRMAINFIDEPEMLLRQLIHVSVADNPPARDYWIKSPVGRRSCTRLRSISAVRRTSGSSGAESSVSTRPAATSAGRVRAIDRQGSGR
jgi:hypothetical protein